MIFNGLRPPQLGLVSNGLRKVKLIQSISVVWNANILVIVLFTLWPPLRPIRSSVDSLKAFQDFYSELFSSTRTFATDQEEMVSNLSKHLSAGKREACEGLLAVEECRVPLKGMVKGSAPGVDGFPMEFYLAFWDILGQDLVAVLNYAYEQGHMSPSQCRGLITLLHKGSERSQRSNWRPTSPLNVDYKIASGSITLRFLKVIDSVVDID